MPAAARGSFEKLMHSPDKPEPKKLLFTRRRGDAEMFFIINFFTPRPLRLRVQKNILPGNGKISRVNY